MARSAKWAVLLCRYLDDKNDPSVVTIKELAAQWVETFPDVVAAGEVSNWSNNTNTILQSYQRLFTSTPAATLNMASYFLDMSHGTVDLSGTQIFQVVVQRTLADSQQAANANPAGSPAFQDDNFHRAKVAFQQQHGLDPASFDAIIVSFQQPDAGSQGGSYDGGHGVYMDVRYVVNNGPMRWGHEMGHGFGLDHSRADATDPKFNPIGCEDGPPDYRDPWDIMSAECCYYARDPTVGPFGPGLNAWNMRGRGWLDETRVWNCPDDIFSQVLTLRPLHRHDLEGYLTAELPPLHDKDVAPADFPRHLVEFRPKAGWDMGLHASYVLVHRYQGPMNQFMGTHSYVEFALGGSPAMVKGDICSLAGEAGNTAVVRVLAIDEQGETATVHISYLPAFLDIAAASNLDGRIEVFCVASDASVRHLWQTSPNGSWTAQIPKIQANVTGKSVTMILNSDNELEVFYVGTNSHVYHNWQTAADGNWHGEAEVSDQDSAKQVVAANNANGRMQIFYRGTNDHLYYNTKQANGSWAGEHDLGNQVTKVATGTNASGALEICYIGVDGFLYHRTQSAVSSLDAWGPQAPFGDFARDFALAECPDGSLEIVYVNGSGALCHSYQDGKGGPWTKPQVLLPFAKTLAVCANSTDVLEMFFTDETDTIFHYRQVQLHQWEAAPTRFVAAAKKMILIRNGDKHLELVYIGTDNALYHNWQIGTSDNWNGELPF